MIIDTFKNFMATVTDMLLQQVMDQVKRAMKETTSRHPLPLLEMTLLSARDNLSRLTNLGHLLEFLPSEVPFGHRVVNNLGKDWAAKVVGSKSNKSYKHDTPSTERIRI